jgi:hypothetical protein
MMEQIDEFSYYNLGLALAPLSEAPNAARKFNDVFFSLVQAITALDAFDKSPFIHAKGAARDIKDRIGDLFKRTRDKDGDGNLNFDSELPPYAFTSLILAIGDFRAILSRESARLPIFFIPQKGLSLTGDLIEQAELDFPEPLRQSLPRDATAEIRQAGKAMAFDLFTAHAFHMMRAAEIVVLWLLRTYYNESIPTAQRNWSQYIKILQKHGPDPALLRFLDEVVRFERNESIHPTKLLTEVEAQMIYTVAKGAIMAMMQHMKNLEAYDPLAALALASMDDPVK